MLLLLSIARPVVQDGRETIPKVPSVTFKGPAGNTRTIKVAAGEAPGCERRGHGRHLLRRSARDRGWEGADEV